MDCIKFQDAISDYLDGEMETCVRAEFAAHRLRCRECRELFGDVRMTVETMGAMAGTDHLGESTALESRILAATTAGEMLSCGDFDRLIERYFDGVILAPTFQQFQEHFKGCHKCRRLMAGIEDAIELFREARETEVDVPPSLTDRIMAATVGAEEQARSRLSRWRSVVMSYVLPFWTPQWAVAGLIFAASTLFVYSRFGGFSGMASEAGARAERIVVEGNEAVTQTGAMAATGIQMVSQGVNNIMRDRKNRLEPVRFRTEPTPPEAAEPAEQKEQSSETEAHATVESNRQGGKKKR
ncbi:MAG TPA: hypothetical protein VFD58_24910 [Blastocatellia bacterium]|nr:hypothetical protein [Blastocatellia bacterium]